MSPQNPGEPHIDLSPAFYSEVIPEILTPSAINQIATNISFAIIGRARMRLTTMPRSMPEYRNSLKLVINRTAMNPHGETSSTGLLSRMLVKIHSHNDATSLTSGFYIFVSLGNLFKSVGLVDNGLQLAFFHELL